MTQEVQAVVEETRQLARIVKIDAITQHPKADRLQLAAIGGWQCVVKIDEFKTGDLALYIEIDSLVPTTIPEFTFLEARTNNLKLVNDKPYSRIKTIRLRDQISQGLLVPVPSKYARTAKEGKNLTEELGILKYEGKVEKLVTPTVREDSTLGRIVRFISGPPRNNMLPWPEFLKKSEQPRIQNLGGRWPGMVAEGGTWERTVKLDGQSITLFNCGRVGVCSRNFEISQTDDVWDLKQQARYWLGMLLVSNRRILRKRVFVFPAWDTPQTADTNPRSNLKKLKSWVSRFCNENQHNKLFTLPAWRRGLFAEDDPVFRHFTGSGELNRMHGLQDLVFQGELCGPGIQDNFEGLERATFFVYNVYRYTEDSGKKTTVEVTPEEAREISAKNGFIYVPVIDAAAKLETIIGTMLKKAEGKKIFTGQGNREGEVWKNNTTGKSFKVISNKYLLAEED